MIDGKVHRNQTNDAAAKKRIKKKLSMQLEDGKIDEYSFRQEMSKLEKEKIIENKSDDDTIIASLKVDIPSEFVIKPKEWNKSNRSEYLKKKQSKSDKKKHILAKLKQADLLEVHSESGVPAAFLLKEHKRNSESSRVKPRGVIYDLTDEKYDELMISRNFKERSLVNLQKHNSNISLLPRDIKAKNVVMKKKKKGKYDDWTPAEDDLDFKGDTRRPHVEILDAFDPICDMFGEIKLEADYSSDDEKSDLYGDHRIRSGWNRGEFDIQDAQYLMSWLKAYKSTMFDIFGDVPFFGNIMVFIYQLYKASNILDYTAAVWQFVSIINLKLEIGDLVDSFIEHSMKLWGNQLESAVDTLEEFLTNFELIFSGELVRCLRTLILQLVSYKFFSKDIATSIYSFLGKDEQMNILDFQKHIIKSLIAMIRSGELLAKGVPLSDVLFANNPLKETIDRLRAVLAKKEMLYIGLPIPGFLSQREFVKEIKCCIDTLEQMEKNFIIYPSHKKEVSALLKEARLAYLSEMQILNSQNRPTPFALMFYGEPGCGKSQLVTEVCKIWSHVKGYTFSESMIFHKNSASEYNEGYQPESMPFLHLSELGNKNVDLAKKNGDDDVLEFCSIIDHLPKQMNMAFEGKGKTYALFDMCVIDTNNRSLNLEYVVNNAAAVRRRIMEVKVTVKSKYRIEGSDSICPIKARTAPNPYDIWLFSVQTSANKVGSMTESVYTTHLHNASYETFSNFLVQAFKDHIDRNTHNVSMFRNYNGFVPKEQGPNDDEKHIQLESHEFSENFRELIGDMGYVPGVPMSYLSVGATMFGALASYSFFPFLTKFSRKFLVAFASRVDVVKYGIGFYFNVLSCGVTATMTYGLLRFASLIPVNKNLSSKVDSLAQEYKHYLGESYFSAYMSRLTEDFPESELERKLKVLLKVIVAIGAAYKLYTYVKPTKKTSTDVKLETHTDFTLNSPYNKFLEEFEERIEVKDAIERKGLANETPIWIKYNTMKRLIPDNKLSNDPMQIYNSIYRNVRDVTVYAGVKPIKTRIFGICNNFALINTHVFRSNSNAYQMKVLISGTDHTRDCIIVKDQIVHVSGDVSLICVNVERFKDIRHFISPSVFDEFYPGIIDRRNVRINTVSNVYADEVEFPVAYSYQWDDHGKGACGTPLLLTHDKHSYVVGIHCAGAKGHSLSYSCPVTSGDIQVAVERMMKITKNFVPFSEELQLEHMSLESPISKSPFRFVSLNTLDYYGKLPGSVSINRKSELRLTPYCSHIERIFEHNMRDEEGNFIYGPPPMKPFVKDGQYISLFNNALEKMERTKRSLDIDILNRIARELVDRFPNKELKPLTFETAINGVAGDPYLNSLNVNSSAGFGLEGKKSKYIPIVIEDDNRILREPESIVKEMMTNRIKSYMRNKSYGAIFKASPKDEARKVKKNLKGETRLFYGGQTDFQILSKQFLAPVFTTWMEDIKQSRIAIGVNMHKEANDLVVDMLELSSNFIEGDFEKFEFAVPPSITGTAYRVIEEICLQSGYNEHAMTILKGILSDMLYPIIEMNKDVFSVLGMQPSGAYGTAEMNSLKSLIIIMYIFYLQCSKNGVDANFFESVRLYTYGDDIGGTVAENIPFKFDNFVIRDCCLQDMGMVYTPASKDGEMTEFVSIHEFSFLKRNFRMSELLGRYVAPLQMDSICKSLIFYIPSKMVSKEKQLVDSMNSALWEYFFHCDTAAQFNDIRDKLFTLCNDYFIMSRHEFDVKFVKFEDLMAVLN